MTRPATSGDASATAAEQCGPRDPAQTFWLTRDRLYGVLRPDVDVWFVRPERVSLVDGDAVWVAPTSAVDAVETNADTWTLADARLRVRSALPETDRECVRVGEDVAQPRSGSYVASLLDGTGATA